MQNQIVPRAKESFESIIQAAFIVDPVRLLNILRENEDDYNIVVQGLVDNQFDILRPKLIKAIEDLVGIRQKQLDDTQQ
jgi:hypothetical protein